MPDVLVSVLVVASVPAVALVLWGVLRAVRDQPVTGRQIPVMALTEIALVVQTVLIARRLGETTADPALLWGYLITQLLLVPVAFGWAFVERTRWSSVVLAVAAAVILVLQVRVWQIWQL